MSRVLGVRLTALVRAGPAVRQGVSAYPDSPALNALGLKHTVTPRVLTEDRVRFLLALGNDDKYDVATVGVSYRAAEKDLSFLAELVDEGSVRLPAGLLTAAERGVPGRPARLSDKEEFGHKQRLRRFRRLTQRLIWRP